MIINHFNISAYVTSLTTIFLGVFVMFFSKWRNKTYKYFSLYTFSVALWAFCVGLFNPSFNDKYGIFGKLLYVGAILIPVFFVEYVSSFLKKKNILVSGNYY